VEVGDVEVAALAVDMSVGICGVFAGDGTHTPSAACPDRPELRRTGPRQSMSSSLSGTQTSSKSTKRFLHCLQKN